MNGAPRTAGPGARPYDDSRPNEIRVPGALATTVHGINVVQSMLRHVLKAKCRLGSFARSFVAQQLKPQQRRGTACSDLFPMPLPYPEVLVKQRCKMSDSQDARKKSVDCIVIVLNYLHLGRPHFFDKGVLDSGRLSKRQWEAVQHFGQLTEAWLEHEPVTPEVMGRTAAKVESLEAVLQSLEEQVSSLAKSGDGYFSTATPVRSQFEESLELKPSKLGSMSTGSMSTFKPVDSSRLSFVGTPSFDPSPYLDPLSQRIFNDPMGMRQDPGACTIKPPLLRVHCSRNEKIKLFDLLDQSDRLRFHTAKEVCPAYGSGLFSVTKNLTKDRLILDSRGANILEQPPGRWIKSLASAESVTRIMLEPHQNLLASGNDLTDFYYLFKATKSRSRRNVLVGGVHPKEVQHLRALRPEHLDEKVIFGALGSLAMGDTQAVELAQSCHLGLALQHDIVTSDNLTTMRKPPPRTQTTVGLVIDDFVTLSKVHCSSSGPSEGADLAERMQDIYEDVKLIPNRKKGFRDEAQSNFWGLDLDGKRGIVRGSLKRAIPLAGLILKIVQIGAVSTDLLQITAGSLISLLLFRRRILALLDSLFEATKGRGARDIFELNGRAKSDLLILTALLPLAATNLRAQPAQVFGASDASNWGEAGVIAKIPREIGKELTRHSLRKSVWTRLLKPGAAWLRAHDFLPADEELPDAEEQIQTNPLWTLLACALEYKVLFAKEKSGARHINVGELRAALKTEKTLSLRRRSTRQLLGLDSQVVLGTLTKGRSSSAALNAELVRSLPWMLALDSYSEGFYFHTSMNRADQPTRGKEIEPPDQALPDWWEDLAAGRFKKFDEWLFEHGLDAETVSELPPLTELCGDVSPQGTLPYFLQSSAESANETVEQAAGEALVDADLGTLPSSSTSARPPKRTAIHGRDQGRLKQVAASCQERPASLDDDELRGGGALPGSTSTAQPPKRTAVFGRVTPPPTPAGKARSLAPVLSAEAKAELGRFRPRQVVKTPGLQWPPERAGFLDLFSGERGVAKSLAEECCTWSLCFDLADGPDQDLDDPALRKRLEDLIKLGCFIGMGGGPVCASFSFAVRPPVRSREEPYGKASASLKMQEKTRRGNDMAIWFFSLMNLSLELGLKVWIENPASSWMFRLPEWTALLEKWKVVVPWSVDYCRFGTPWRKRTKFFSNTAVGGFKTHCTGGHEHQLLKGRSRKHKCSWTRVAQAYPKGVARTMSLALAMSCHLIPMQRHFDPAGVAKCGSGRIGEASNPGPRRPRQQQRLGVLEEVPLVEAKTRALQDKIWGGFVNWLKDTLSPPAVRSAMSHPVLLVQFAKDYGNYLYATGKSLYVYRHLVVFMQQNFVTIKPYMGLCWTMISRWEMMEPTVHRVPLPAVLFRAMLSICIGWGWKRFASILILGFLGIARPGEPLAAKRREQVLPSDMMSEGPDVVYLKILKPKTRFRGRGLTQHISVHEPVYIAFLESVYRASQPDERLYDCSAGSFRRRWDAILDALLVPRSANLTPGGIRGGGCVYAFQQGTELTKLLWRMRIKHLQTLESYLQEVAASTIVSELPKHSRERIRCAAALTSVLLAAQSPTQSLVDPKQLELD